MRSPKFKNTLIFKLLVAITVSFLASIVALVCFSRFIISFINVKYIVESSVATYYIILFILITFVILSFIVTFFFMVRRKILYLKMITESVNDIANGKLGMTIEIKGNDEITKLVNNINLMSIELGNKFEYERQLEKAKNELITNVSHDLRSPLTSIIGYLDLLRKGQYSDKEQLHDYLETTHSKSKRLGVLIDELFEYTRLTSPDVKLNFSKIDLASLLEQMIGEYIPIFENEKLSIEKSISEEEIIVEIDVEKMVRVYENLFMNAIKYSIKPSELQVSLVNEGDMAVSKISNKVEKPPTEDINMLFERFFTGDKARMNNRGTGLGLAISKRIVELHQGSIRAEFKDGWMTFIVEYPVQNQ
ncbi:sensor histidine kinase [Bacillus andreraoultii]|uniref:sensor histidine kinase n=1 Tax=Bacillus andreraoultii TaxID=1499685 RepID=UPI00053A42BC|nr:HAMP domain-containing sensor histidine kinase [Bacillus andreraoultii]